jgi:RNA polymerase sigma factor (TIGR02999 family)
MNPSSDHSAFNVLRRFVVENLDEMKQTAAKQAARESPDNSLNASALVNEVVVKLLNADKPVEVKNNGHFLAVTTNMMKHILVDRARRIDAVKNGGEMQKHPIDSRVKDDANNAVDLLIIQEELELLTREDPIAASVVKLRCQGYSVEEVAEQLKYSRTTTYNLWNFGRAWLLRRFQTPADVSSSK